MSSTLFSDATAPAAVDRAVPVGGSSDIKIVVTIGDILKHNERNKYKNYQGNLLKEADKSLAIQTRRRPPPLPIHLSSKHLFLLRRRELHFTKGLLRSTAVFINDHHTNVTHSILDLQLSPRRSRTSTQCVARSSNDVLNHRLPHLNYCSGALGTLDLHQKDLANAYLPGINIPRQTHSLTEEHLAGVPINLHPELSVDFVDQSPLIVTT